MAPDAGDLAPYRPQVVQNLMRILDHEDAVHERDPDHYDILSLRTPGRRVTVYRRGDQWRCRSDKTNNQDQPCAHILAALVYQGILELPNTAATVYRKTDQPRNTRAENEAWHSVPTEAPRLLALLLNQALPAFAPPIAIDPRGGRPAKPVYAQLYQSVLRVLWRQSLRATRGSLRMADHRAHNPYGDVGVATQCRFLAKPETTMLLEKLLAVTTAPARPYESVVHPDGTGLTEQRFSSYFDERYAKRKRDDAPDPSLVGPPKPAAKPRQHIWTFAEILWTYQYTLIAALHVQQGPFGEAPWLIPLLRRASLTLDVRELGGDKAYDANYIYEYARLHGIDAQVKIRRTPLGGRYSHRHGARKRAREGARVDPLGYAARANRRNNAETGNHAFKAILGDQLYSKGATAQRNEVLCMALAYNLTRLVYLGVERGIPIDFAQGVRAVSGASWEGLDALYAAAPKGSKAGIRPEWSGPGAQASPF